MGLSKNFITKSKEKFIENILSIKVWVIFIFLLVSSLFLYIGLLDGSVWAGANGGVISTVIALREAFKVAKVRTPKVVAGNDEGMMV